MKLHASSHQQNSLQRWKIHLAVKTDFFFPFCHSISSVMMKFQQHLWRYTARSVGGSVVLETHSWRRMSLPLWCGRSNTEGLRGKRTDTCFLLHLSSKLTFFVLVWIRDQLSAGLLFFLLLFFFHFFLPLICRDRAPYLATRKRTQLTAK